MSNAAKGAWWMIAAAGALTRYGYLYPLPAHLFGSLNDLSQERNQPSPYDAINGPPGQSDFPY